MKHCLKDKKKTRDSRQKKKWHADIAGLHACSREKDVFFIVCPKLSQFHVVENNYEVYELKKGINKLKTVIICINCVLVSKYVIIYSIGLLREVLKRTAMVNKHIYFPVWTAIVTDVYMQTRTNVPTASLHIKLNTFTLFLLTTTIQYF